MRLVDRWGGWQQEPFAAASNCHLSVYPRKMRKVIAARARMTTGSRTQGHSLARNW